LPPGFEQRLVALYRILHHRPEIQLAPLQGDLAGVDARDIQQVIDQPDDDIELPIEDGEGLVRHGRRRGTSRRISTALRMGASGLRSSWANIAGTRLSAGGRVSVVLHSRAAPTPLACAR
jgi:hypothetical protein